MQARCLANLATAPFPSILKEGVSAVYHAFGILQDDARPTGRASAFKVSHHGSASGDAPEVWQRRTPTLRQQPPRFVRPARTVPWSARFGQPGSGYVVRLRQVPLDCDARLLRPRNGRSSCSVRRVISGITSRLACNGLACAGPVGAIAGSRSGTPW